MRTQDFVNKLKEENPRICMKYSSNGAAVYVRKAGEFLNKISEDIYAPEDRFILAAPPGIILDSQKQSKLRGYKGKTPNGPDMPFYGKKDIVQQLIKHGFLKGTVTSYL